MKFDRIQSSASAYISNSPDVRPRGLVFAAVGIIAIGTCTAFSAASTVINYPVPMVRPDVTYTALSESDSTNTSLYNAPLTTTTSDTLAFHNLSFSANSGFTNGGQFVDGQLSFTLAANAGKTLQSIEWDEAGDYNVTQFGPTGTDIASISLQPFIVTLWSTASNPGMKPVTKSGGELTFLPSNTFQTTLAGPNTGLWTGSAIINLQQLFGVSDITQVSVSYDNQLSAYSTSSGIASITKKSVDITPTVGSAAVPEPASLAMAFTGCLVLLRRCRR